MIILMNINWKFPNTIGTIIFFNPIITTTSFAMNNRIKTFRNTSSTIPQNGKTINFLNEFVTGK